MKLPTALRRLATLAIKRAREYRAPYEEELAQTEMPASFVRSGSYPIYATLQELHLLLNALADEIDDETEGKDAGS